MKRNILPISMGLVLIVMVIGCNTKRTGIDSTLIYSKKSVVDTNVVLPPSWAFGVLYGGYTNQEQTIERVKKIKKHDYPIDAYWIDSWFWSFDDEGEGPDKYLDFVADTVAFPDRKKMWSYLESQNIKGGFWTWDCILKTGNEEVYEIFEKEGYFSSTYVNTNSWHNSGTSTAMFQESDDHPGTWCGNIDFNNPQAVSYFKKRMKHFFDEGADFIKLDRTAEISTSKVMFEMSQEYGKESKGRGFMLAHSFGTEDDRYKRYPAKWTDDTRSDWTIEEPTKDFNSWVPKVALKENMAMFTNPDSETSKIPFLTNDTGGFDMGKTEELDEELYIRWVEFSTFNPIMEVFSQPENTTGNIAYNYSERADSIFRKYSHLRIRLFPYIYSYALQSRLKSVNIIRPIEDHLYQYKFGDEFLVAPIYERGKKDQMVYLPAGDWVNYWTNEKIEGEIDLKVKAPLGQVPLFVKEGGIIPMREYSSSIEEGTNNMLFLHIFPGSEGGFSLFEDDGMTNDYLNGAIAETKFKLTEPENGKFELVISKTTGSYKGMPKSRKIQVILHSAPIYSSYSLKEESVELKQEKDRLKTKIFEISADQQTTLEFH